MKVACICCTYKRPNQLANAIACFEWQDYPDRELIVLDDVGQYAGERYGDRWRLVSFPARFRSVGEKRNATAALTSPDVSAYFVWDDDDAYLPWHISAAVEQLQSGADYTIPRKLWIRRNGGPLQPKRNQYMFHGGWSFRRHLFQEVGGYPFIQSGQDQALLGRFKNADAKRAYVERPSYVYRWCDGGGYHLSGRHTDERYRDLERLPVRYQGFLKPELEEDWRELVKDETSPKKRDRPIPK